MSDLTASAGAIPISMGLHDLPKRLPKPTNTYPHASWRHQLRDRLGQWIEMGTGVKWLAGGAAKQGHIVGSTAPGSAIIEETGTKRRVSVPTNRLTAFLESPSGSWIHAKPDDPTELTIRAIKSERIVLDVPVKKVAPAAPLTVAPGLAIPKDLGALTDKRLEELYWAARDNPKIKTRMWMRVAIEVQRRKINISSEPFLPPLMLADGSPADLTEALKRMEARIIQRELLTG